MTPGPLARMRRAVVGLACLASVTALIAGCDPRQAMYFLQPLEPKIPPPCPPLKGKRVVVLTANVAQSDYPAIDREITDKLVPILRKEIKKIDVVDPEKVRDWARTKPSLTDPAEAARAFEADVVIFLEIQQFQVQTPRDLELLQGQSNIHIQVTELDYPKDDRGKPLTDKPKESNVIYEGDRITQFPTTGGRPIESGVSRTTFKNTFMKVVMEELSWHFVDHAAGDDIHNNKIGE